MSDSGPGGGETVENEDDLYRRLIRYHVKKNGTVSSAAYRDKGGSPIDSISVDLGRLTTPEETLARDDRGFRLGALVAGVPRELGFDVRHVPRPANYSHCVIEGENDMEKCYALAAATTVIV